VNGTETTERTFPATAESLPDMRTFLRERAAAAELSEATTDDLLLAVSEACANAVLHSGSDVFDVEWLNGPRTIEVVVRDRGTFRRRVRLPSTGPGASASRS
jgi:anti-sigma regulatory factor (Ser/Thr protein kinase)